MIEIYLIRKRFAGTRWWIAGSFQVGLGEYGLLRARFEIRVIALEVT